MCTLRTINYHILYPSVMDFFLNFSHKKNTCGSQKLETNLDWVQLLELLLLELLRQGLPSWHPFCLWLISVLVSPHHCYYHLLHLDSSFQSLFQNHHYEIINGACLFLFLLMDYGKPKGTPLKGAVTLFK